MSPNIRVKLLVIYTLLLVLAGSSLVTKATDPPVTLGRWINYGAGTLNFPGGYTITDLAVDNQERLWIGTRGGGIAVFDGIAWTRYTESDGLVSDYVKSVTARSSAIWISTASGVSAYDFAGDSWTTYTTADDLPSNIVNAVAFRGAGFNSILYATVAGLAECVSVWPSGQSCTVYTSSNSDLVSDHINDITIDGQR